MSAHTPGPWTVATSNSWRRIVTSSRMTSVCEPVVQSDGHPDLYFCNGGEDGPDARLIAAAPDLLAACQAQLSLDKFSDDPAYPENEESKRAWFAELYRRGALAKSLLADAVAKATTGGSS